MDSCDSRSRIFHNDGQTQGAAGACLYTLIL